jgi:hypothetical protein
MEIADLDPLGAKHYYKTNFILLGRDPHGWLFCAQLLKKSADLAQTQVLIDKDASTVQAGWINSIYKYLAGITIENLLKGIIIADHPTLISKDKISDSIGKHDPWTRHADKLQTVKKLLNKEERKLLKILESYVLWKGRYPIALTANDYARDLLNRRKEPPLEIFIATFGTLYEKLLNELNKKENECIKIRGYSGAMYID